MAGELAAEKKGGVVADTPKPIQVLLGEILAEMPAIGKTQRNTQQNFMFRGHDDVMNALNPLLASKSIIIVPRVLDRVTAQRTTARGTIMYEVNLHIAFRFYGPAGDYVEASGWGEGTDMGDKSTSKATTMAFKYVLNTVLALSTAEASAHDADRGSPEQTYASPDNSRSRPERRVEGGVTVSTPRTWAQVQESVRDCDNPDEAWAIFQAFGRAASYHLYGETNPKKLSKEQNRVMLQKAAGAAIWLHESEHVKYQGEFRYFGEPEQRGAWASVLEGHLLEIPDYKPPAKAEQADLSDEELKAEADRLVGEYEAAIKDIE